MWANILRLTKWIWHNNPIAWLFGAIVAVVLFLLKLKDIKIDRQEGKIDDLIGKVKHAEHQTEITEIGQEAATTAIIEEQALDDKQEEQEQEIEESENDAELIENINSGIADYNNSK